MKSIVYITFILALSTSCVTLKRCKEKFGSGQTHSITLRDTITVRDTVITQPDSLRGNVDLNDFFTGKYDSLVHVSSSQKLTLKLWIDKYTKLLHYRADVKPDTIIVVKEIPVEITGPCPDAVVMDPEKGLGWRDELWKKFQFFSAFLVLAGLWITALIFIYRLIRR